VCVYLFITLVSGLFILGVWVPGGFSGGPGHIFFLHGAPLCGVSVRYNLFKCLPGVGGGAVQVFLLLGSVVVSTVRFIWVLAGSGWRGCTGFLLLLFDGLVFSKLLILFFDSLQVVEEGYGSGGLWALAGADAIGASQVGFGESYRGLRGRGAGSEGQSCYVGGWGEKGCGLLWDLQSGLSDLPAEIWAGYCGQPAVCLWLDGVFGVEWCVTEPNFIILLFPVFFLFCFKIF
jgi:hypothetical protein